MLFCCCDNDPLVHLLLQHLYKPEEDHIVTAASCTTNCLAPVVKVGLLLLLLLLLLHVLFLTAAEVARSDVWHLW